MISPSIAWLKYTVAELGLRGSDDIVKWLRDQEEAMYDVYRRSNIYSMMRPFMQGGLCVGTIVMLAMEELGKDRIVAQVPHPSENFMQFDMAGKVLAYHRRFKKTALEAAQDFEPALIGKDTLPGKKSKLSDALQRDLKNGNHWSEHEFILAIYPAEDPILKDEKTNRPWMEYYVEVANSEPSESREAVSTKGHWTCPVIAWRPEVNSNENYGRGPAWNSLIGTKGLNEMERTLLQAGQRAIEPPVRAHRSYRGRLRLGARGVNYFKDPTETIDAIQQHVDYPFADDVFKRKQGEIQEWFHYGFWTMLTRMAAEGGSPPTATQIIDMRGEKTLLLGPIVERSRTDILEPLDDRVWDIAMRAGWLPPAPDILLELGSGEIETEFMGPIVQAQRMLFAIRNPLEALANAASIMEIWPEAKYKVKPGVAVEKILEEGFYPEAIRSQDEYEEMLRRATEMEAMERAVAAGREAAEGISKLQGPTDATSPIARGAA
jgi:hypothetical protein